ncbi:brain acid soluble protein 1-like [Sycon ciliatum]|uniref:brain acid soluble protein 1-like n=1 Tax=Sycon ciliatum TaxID=27933 RepID=UPI0031F60E7F
MEAKQIEMKVIGAAEKEVVTGEVRETDIDADLHVNKASKTERPKEEATFEVRETDIDADLPINQTTSPVDKIKIPATMKEEELQELPRPRTAPEQSAVEEAPAVGEAASSPPPVAEDAALLEQNALERACAPLCSRVSERLYRCIMVFGFVCLAGMVVVFVYFLVKLLLKKFA